MHIKSLKLTNFQGMKDFTLNADYKNCEIRGTNSVGKTTIYNSFCFLLYGLDSNGKTFLPKPVNESGEPRHDVASSVEAIFTLENNDEITLKKTFKENWVKRRNGPKKTFIGHSTSHWINLVPLTETLYKKRLAEIAPEQVFKLLTNVRYFSETLPWQERRQILLDICGDISSNDIIKADPALSRVPEILGDKTLDDQKKIMTSQKTSLNKELEALPIRIDEAEKILPDVAGLDLSVLEKNLSTLTEQIKSKNEEAARISSGGEMAEQIKKQRTLESEILDLKNKALEKQNEAEEKQRKKRSELAVKEASILKAWNKTQLEINQKILENNAAEQTLSKLRVSWDMYNAQIFDKAETVCPTCGQDYPPEQAQKIKETFHEKKAANLTAITQEGKNINVEIEKRKRLNMIDHDTMIMLQSEIDTLKKRKNKLQPQDTPASVKQTKKQKALDEKLINIKTGIEILKSDKFGTLKEVRDEIDTLAEKKSLVVASQQIMQGHQKGLLRIKDLTNQQRLVAGQYEKIEADLFVLEKFIRAKASALEKEVNSFFERAEFRLFNILVNGSLESCCTVCYKGIGWDNGLNFSSKIQTGIDIINTLSKHFGLTMPLFIDSAESIIELIPTECQIIKLIVDKDYAELAAITT